MKKTVLAIMTLTQILCYGQSKKRMVFKVQYNPETEYRNTIEQSFYSELRYSGSDEFLQKLKNNGIKNPTITNRKSTTVTLLKTEKSIDGKNFPLTIEILKTTSSDEKKDLTDGLLIYGHGSNGKMPILDSIVSDNIDKELKATILQSMQTTFSQLDFPERKVKVGESFSWKTPLSIPIAGVTIEMIITNNYKLLGISNRIAEIDISQVYTMQTIVTQYIIHATGSGKGKMLYDTINNNFLRYYMDTEMDLSMKLDHYNLNLKTQSGFTQLTEITKKINK